MIDVITVESSQYCLGDVIPISAYVAALMCTEAFHASTWSGLMKSPPDSQFASVNDLNRKGSYSNSSHS